VTYRDGAKWVNVTYPFQGAESGYSYLLVEKNQPIPEHTEGTRVMTIPIETIVCTSTTHIPLLDYLGETDRLIGFPSMEYISSQPMRKRIDAGLVQELGVDKGMNLEVLASLQPDMVMGYTMSSDFGQFKKVEELGSPVVINAEYLEKHPLGRAEWIKFMALFFNKEKEADSIFSAIESEYFKTAELVKTKKSKPTVISGIVYGDAWFLPGGQNYAAKILNDAGCNYLYKDDSTSGFLELSFESVYNKAVDVDLWIGVGSYTNLDEIALADHRYTNLKAFKTKKAYTYNARIGATGGSEFLELGYLRPDIILKDLVKIAYPELLPDHELYFHKKLE
jgi:iron complex transport system substrate-binding protein